MFTFRHLCIKKKKVFHFPPLKAQPSALLVHSEFSLQALFSSAFPLVRSWFITSLSGIKNDQVGVWLATNVTGRRTRRTNTDYNKNEKRKKNHYRIFCTARMFSFIPFFLSHCANGRGDWTKLPFIFHVNLNTQYISMFPGLFWFCWVEYIISNRSEQRAVCFSLSFSQSSS